MFIFSARASSQRLPCGSDSEDREERHTSDPGSVRIVGKRGRRVCKARGNLERFDRLQPQSNRESRVEDVVTDEWRYRHRLPCRSLRRTVLTQNTIARGVERAGVARQTRRAMQRRRSRAERRFEEGAGSTDDHDSKKEKGKDEEQSREWMSRL